MRVPLEENHFKWGSVTYWASTLGSWTSGKFPNSKQFEERMTSFPSFSQHVINAVNVFESIESARPVRWVWGARVLGEWAVWRYVHLPSTQPGAGGSSPCCRLCWSRPRFVAALPPPRWKLMKHQGRSEDAGMLSRTNKYTQAEQRDNQ